MRVSNMQVVECGLFIGQMLVCDYHNGQSGPIVPPLL